MVLELLSQSNYQSYNVKLAHLLGLNSAIYFNALLEINEKACRKNKLYDNDFFKIDREYITERTTITNKEQVKIEKSLIDCDLLKTNDTKDGIKVNVDVLISLLKDENESIRGNLTKLNKAAQKSNAKQYALEKVKNNLSNEMNPELKVAYLDWLDAVNDRFGFVSKQMLFTAQKTVDDFSNHDLDVALDVIHIASANCWKDMSYAVNKYKQLHPANRVVEMKNIEINTEVVY